MLVITRCGTFANPTALASAAFAQILIVKDRSASASHMDQQGTEIS
jgi:hypothetical protein